jgi:hypothetical protein
MDLAVFVASAQSHVHQDRIVNTLSTLQEHAVNGVLAGTESARDLLAQFPGAAVHIRGLADAAFVAGMHAGFRLDLALSILGLVVAFLFVGGRPRWQPREVKSADRAVETGSFSPPGR